MSNKPKLVEMIKAMIEERKYHINSSSKKTVRQLKELIENEK